MPENRGNAGRFKPGVSGNSGGRPKAVREVEALARQRTAEAIGTLVHWMRSDNGAAAVKAAALLLDRGWGRAPVEVTVEDVTPQPKPDLSRLTDEEIETFLRIVKKMHPTETEPGDGGEVP